MCACPLDVHFVCSREQGYPGLRVGYRPILVPLRLITAHGKICLSTGNFIQMETKHVISGICALLNEGGKFGKTRAFPNSEYRLGAPSISFVNMLAGDP